MWECRYGTPPTLQRVLTCEWIDGCKITDASGLERMKVDRADVRSLLQKTLSTLSFPCLLLLPPLSLLQVCHKLVEAFSLQIFQTGFVHGDPHPGNSECSCRGRRGGEGKV